MGAAEIGKDVWNMGTKLGMNIFKSGNLGKGPGDPKCDFESESVTSCEATTSYQDDKPKSSSNTSRAEVTADADDENDEVFNHIKKHDEGSDNEGWVEKTRDNLDKIEGKKEKRS